MDGKTTTNTTDFKVTADAVIKAVWKGPYTMTFIVDGEEVASITQISGTKVTPPEDPVKEGYIFAGWDVAVPGTMPTKNMVFVAQWKLPQAAVVAADLPETGDPGSLMNWIALLGVSGIAAKALRSRKR